MTGDLKCGGKYGVDVPKLWAKYELCSLPGSKAFLISILGVLGAFWALRAQKYRKEGVYWEPEGVLSSKPVGRWV